MKQRVVEALRARGDDAEEEEEEEEEEKKKKKKKKKNIALRSHVFF